MCAYALNFPHSHANHAINTFIQLDKMEAKLVELHAFYTLHWHITVVRVKSNQMAELTRTQQPNRNREISL